MQNNVPNNISNNTPVNTSNNIPNNIPNNTPGNISNNMPNNFPSNTLNNMPNNVTNKKKIFYYIIFIAIITLATGIGIYFYLTSNSNSLLLKDNVVLVLGDKLSLSSKPTNEYTWTSSNESIVTVDNYGFIEAISAGSSVIQVSYQGKLEKCNVIVKTIDESVQTEKITLHEKNITMNIGDTDSLKYTIEPKNATNKNVTLYSSNQDIVTIENGKILAKSAGQAIITIATGDGNVDTCVVEVVGKSGESSSNNSNTDSNNNIGNSPSNNVTSIAFNDKEVTLKKGEKCQLTYTIIPKDIKTTLIWNSSNKKIVSVNNGVVIGKSVGTATITVHTSDGKKTSIKVHVTEAPAAIIPVSSITLDSSNVTLSVGDTLKVNASIMPANATYKDITWTSGNENVATVQNGLITAKWGGVSTITAKSNNGVIAQIKVTVKNYNLILDDGNFLTTKGTKIVKKKNGKQVSLKGFNLGAWLSRSLSFMPVIPIANSKSELKNKGYSCVNSEAFMQSLSRNPNVGSSKARTLSKILYDNFITEKDLDLIAQSGATVVRVPFEYSLIMNDDGTYKTNSNGQIDFYYLDWIVQQCKKRGIYVILDLHLVPGRQNQGGWCDDYTFFKNNKYQNYIVDMWKKTAAHFAGETAVAGYDIINEPQATKNTLVPFYDKVYQAIRSVDNNHIIFMEETCVYCGYSGVNNSGSIGDLPNPASIDNSIGKNNKWLNVVYSTHDYFYDKNGSEPLYDTTSPTTIKTRVYEKTNKTINKAKSYNIPYYIGEFSHLGNYANYPNYLGVWKEAMQYYDNNNLNYTAWTYKGHWDRYFGLVFYGSNITKANVEKDSYSNIEKVFRSQSSTAMKFNKEFYLMFLEQWNGRLASSITLSNTNLSLKVGTNKTINYTVNIEPNRISGGYKNYDVINKKVTWSSSNPNVVTIDPVTGNMTAKSAGTATITATLNPLMLSEKSVYASCKVTVVN